MTDPAIQAALRHHHAGRLASAEEIYRNILVKDPKDADALHLLGALSAQKGQMDVGIDLIRRAISARPNYPMALKNLGATLAQAGRFEESVSAYKRLLELTPADPAAHNDLGSVLLRQDRFDEAIALFSRATALDSAFADAFKNLSYAYRKKGLISEALAASSRVLEIKPAWTDGIFDHGQNLEASGRAEEALSQYRRAIALKPDYADASNEAGRILMEMGRPDESIAVFAKAIQLTPDRAQLHFNLGIVLRKADRIDEAVVAFTTATRLNPDYYDAYANMAKALAKLDRFEEALVCQAKAAALMPDASLTHEVMGEIALARLDAGAAIEHFRRAVAADPNSPTAQIELGMALQAQGKFDEAQASFRKAIEFRPELVGIYQNLMRTGNRVAGEAEIKRLTEISKQADVSPSERASLQFALGKALDENDSFDEAFAHYAEGNSIAKELRGLAGDRYDPEEERRAFDQMIETFTPRFFQERRGWGDPSNRPVFVVGMPRSGTTLVHQIAASHPDVHGIGESSDIQKIARALGAPDARSAALGWRADAVGKAARQLLGQYRSLNQSALRTVDKQPGNVIFLGLISLLFPGAHVILCRRDPRDTSLSCYFQDFAAGNSFAFDLVHCGLHQVQIDRLMDHWVQALPIQMLEVQYETLVADLEGQVRRIISFLGLPWNPACLDFQQAKTAVLTASVWQVRQPIYQSSVGRWRNYERHLGPLLKALQGAQNTSSSSRR